MQEITQVKIPDYTASERQSIFHRTTADEKLYGGAAGGGKTAAIVAEAVTLALEYPGIPINLFRRTIPELNKTIKPEIIKQCWAYIKAGNIVWHGQASGDKDGRSYEFANGSTIILNYCDTDADIYRYQGAEMPVIGIDELTQFPQAWVEYLLTRNRTSNHDWPVLFMAGTNPGGIGHGWVKQRFIDPIPPEQINTVMIDGGDTSTRVFIPAKVDDHPDERFKKDYKRKLSAITDPQLRRALRDGDWDTFAGQVFTEWRRDLHVCEPFTIPEHWKRWRSMDYGNKNSTLWYARDPQTERNYVYREYHTDSFLPIEEKARTTLMLEQGESVSFGLADPAIWKGAADHNTGKTVAEIYLDNGVKWMPANNDRMAGLAIVHDALSIMDDGRPKTIFFSTCLSSIRTIPALPYDLHKVDDVDTDADDHDYDSFRYGMMGTRKADTSKEGGRMTQTRGRNAKLPPMITHPDGTMTLPLDLNKAYYGKRTLRR